MGGRKPKGPSRSLSRQEELLEEQKSYLANYRKRQLTAGERLKKYVWNPEKKKVLGRTAASWSKIGLFYTVFYGMLAALVAICMWVFFQTLDPRIPKWQLDRSLIGTNPGLGFRPMSMSNEESTLIWFKGSNASSYKDWVKNLNAFLEKYYTPSKIAKGNGQIKTCSYQDPPHEGEVCEVDVRDWDKCNRDVYYNYHKNAPCIFLKLNRIYGWTPDYYSDPNRLPGDMPETLKQHIRSINSTRERHNVWLSCEGENPADKEYLGPVTYYPKDIQGFPGYYFPYKNAEGYLSPLVAVSFERPKAGVVINVECRAWAKNIHYSRFERTGSVHFELLID